MKLMPKLTINNKNNFVNLIEVNTPLKCWKWSGAKMKNGYGVVTIWPNVYLAR